MANETATRLGLGHLTFKCADAGQVSFELQEYNPDLVLVNPPRRGLGESLNMIQNARATHLIYSSCCLETLAADLRKLIESYQVRKAQIFDMFPHTRHFETLVWLEKRHIFV